MSTKHPSCASLAFLFGSRWWGRGPQHILRPRLIFECKWKLSMKQLRGWGLQMLGAVIEIANGVLPRVWRTAVCWTSSQ